MRYQLLGNSGLRVSELCFGAMSFGDTWGYGSDEQASRACFEAYVQAGGNFFDTASTYTDGNSEKMLGSFMGADRERYIVASKCTLSSAGGPAHPGDVNDAGNGRKHLRQELENSLRQLGTEYLDVLYLHAWDFSTPVLDVMRTLNDFVSSGKVSYLGVSNTPAYIVAQANAVAAAHGWAQFDVYEGKYNLIHRSAELEVIPMVEDLGLSLTVWQPLAGALLSGSEDEVRIRIAAGYPEPDARTWEAIQTVGQIAADRGVSSAQVGLNWIRQRSTSVIPIIGVRLPEHVTDNVAAVDWKLTDDEMARLNELMPPELPYPQADLKSTINQWVYNHMTDDIEFGSRRPAWMR